MSIKFNEKFLKILYKVLTVFLITFWAIFAGLFVYDRIERKYIYPLSYKETVVKYADEYGLNRALIFAIIKTESNFNLNAKSSAGAVGLMQITEDTGLYIAQKLAVKEYDLFAAETNIKFGCYYIKYLYYRFNDMDTALIAYNAGEGNVSEWLSDRNLSRDGKTLKEIPFAETKEYIKKIHENFSKYKKLYGNILDKRQNFE